ncbi:LPS export ABC transporter periplasmic protein LptC [Endozoicomonas sp. Mp262]|uniref:LPS export ABC transporter periplasmic protein LptC n=1 Tax=Endozoicomonas sp. Mp262 TaxID=2919499 RepID=UPI0021DF75AE
MFNRNLPIFLSLLFMLLAMGYWAYDTDLHPGTQKKSTDARKNADYFLEQANILQYGKGGKLEYQLTSQSISHYPHNDTTLLSLPHMTSYRKTGQITTAHAANGKLLSGNDTLVLWNNVIMNQDKISTGRHTRMNTDYLTLYSDQGMAETDLPVLITSNNSKVRAIGMKTYYEKGQIHLKSRVRGVHESN